MRTLFIASFLLSCSCVAALNAQDQSATITFYRDPRFATGNFKPILICDRIELARIENGTYFQVTASPGPHSCTTESLKQPPIEVNAVAGNTAYVHVRIEPGLKDRAALANTTKSEYDKQKSRLRPLMEWSRNSLVSPTGEHEPTVTPQPEQGAESDAAPQGQDESSWLHPSDAEYQYALDLGFEKLKPGRKDIRPLHFVSRLQSELTSQIDVQPPLVCALNQSAARAKRLDSEPTVEEAREECDGQLTVMVVHYSTVLNPDRPIVLDHSGERVKPTVSRWDHNPRVTRYDGGFLAQDQVGYEYVDFHYFSPKDAWSDRVTFVTADPLGKESSFVYDFRLLAKNEQEMRLQASR